VNPADLLNGTSAPIQDFIILSGEVSPGTCEIVNAGSPRTWDKQKGWGYSGATLVYTGDDLSDFDVIVTLWEKGGQQWADWYKFAKILEKPPTGVRAKALEIVHPVLNRPPLKITQVVIRDVGQPVQSKTGLWTIRISMTAYRGALPALGRPNGNIPRASTGIDPFESDPQIQALIAKQAALGGAL
jgi:hypothetical protein